jgi:F-type H+-transporting ATPase subunit epsilon
MSATQPHVLGGKLTLSIVTPEVLAFDGPVDLVVVPGYDGEVAFLPGHAAYVGLLGAGEIRCHVPSGGTERWFLAGGVVQVVDNVVSVLAETVTPVASLDLTKSRLELETALATKATDEPSTAAKEKAVSAARAKIRIASR